MKSFALTLLAMFALNCAVVAATEAPVAEEKVEVQAVAEELEADSTEETK